jgi:putative ABC transport system permease protein
VHFTDTNFFKIFDFEFVEGNAQTALDAPDKMVISQQTARKFFGKNPAYGKTLKIGQRTYTISGVIQSNKHESHLRPNILRSTLLFPENYLQRLNRDWTLIGYYTYLKFPDDKALNHFQSRLEDWKKQTIQPWIEHHELTYILDFKLQQLETIHFLTEYDYDMASNTNPKYLYIFGYVALFILLIVCINYINLATAKSARRANEVGIRKTMGAQRKQLIGQFIGEALVVSFASLLVAGFLVELLLPAFNNLTGKELTFTRQLFSLKNGTNLLVLIGATLTLGLISGIFPAFILSRYKALSIMGQSFLTGKNKGRKSAKFRKGLVIFQFVVTSAMIIATLIVLKQMYFMRNQNLGFNKERMVIIEVPTGNEIQQQLESIQTEMKQQPGVKDAALSMDFPGFSHGRLTFYIEENGKFRQEMINYYRVDENFTNILDIGISKGRFFSKEFPSDPESSVVINEAAKKIFGDNPLGNKVKCGLGVNGKIIGVTENFNYASLHHHIEPLVFLYKPKMANYIGIKIDGNKIPSTLQSIEKTWKKFDTKHPYIYRFLDDQFDNQYKREEKMLRIFGYFSVLTILLACLGLFGLAAFMAEQKRKEIGIRKVMGSSTSNIVKRFVSQYLLWIIIANAISWPIAYWAMNQWLQNFAFRTNPELQIFLAAAFITLVLALGTISYHAFKAANTNPAEVLRDE